MRRSSSSRRLCFLFLLLLWSPLLHSIQFAGALKLQANNTCQLVTFIPFSDPRIGPPEPHNDPGVDYYGYGQWLDSESLGKAAFSLMAAAEMARQHFNNRDAAVVPELVQLENCSITLNPPIYADSAYDRVTAVETLLRVEQQAVAAGAPPNGNVCAVVGPVEPRASEGTAILVEQFRIPQIGYATKEQTLSSVDSYPYYVRLIPNMVDFLTSVAEYLQRDVWQRDFLAVIYDQGYRGRISSPFEKTRKTLGHKAFTEKFEQGNKDAIAEGLDIVKEAGYRTIVLLLDREAILKDVADLAEERGMLGDNNYFWILSGDVLPPEILMARNYLKDSPVAKLLSGAAMFTNYDRFVYTGESDKFLKAWRNQSNNLAEHVYSLHPPRADGSEPYTPSSNYFQEETPAFFSSFVYDSVMTAALSACAAQTNGGSHREWMTQTPFQGASGNIRFSLDGDDTTNDRDPNSILFGMYNLRPSFVDSSGYQRFQAVLTATYSDGAWNATVDHVFYDGTTDEPLPKITTVSSNYISRSVFALGIFLACFSTTFILVSAIWLYCKRNERIVSVNQPVFLELICFGSLMMALSLFCISFDEEKGWSQKQLDIGCAFFPWLFCVGYLIVYGSIFSKLWRLDQLLQMRRRKIGFFQVIIPFCCIVAACLIILLVWQIVDPLTWTRETISEEPFETYGECSVSDSLLPFIIPLGILFGFAMVITAVLSWKLKDVQEDLSDSRWVFFGILTHLQTWAIGIPVVIITDDNSRDASYIMQAALTFIFSTSMVGLLIWPKAFKWFQEKYLGGAKKTTKINVSGRASSRVSGINLRPIESDRPSSSLQLVPEGVSMSRADSARASVNASEYAALLARVNELEHAMNEGHGTTKNGSTADSSRGSSDDAPKESFGEQGPAQVSEREFVSELTEDCHQQTFDDLVEESHSTISKERKVPLYSDTENPESLHEASHHGIDPALSKSDTLQSVEES